MGRDSGLAVSDGVKLFEELHKSDFDCSHNPVSCADDSEMQTTD